MSFLYFVKVINFRSNRLILIMNPSAWYLDCEVWPFERDLEAQRCWRNSWAPESVNKLYYYGGACLLSTSSPSVTSAPLTAAFRQVDFDILHLLLHEQMVPLDQNRRSLGCWIAQDFWNFSLLCHHWVSQETKTCYLFPENRVKGPWRWQFCREHRL